MSDPFDDFAIDNELNAAINQAEQWYAHNHRDSYSNVDVMRRAWDSLDPTQQAENMEDLFNGYWHRWHDVTEARAMADLARANGESFLHHDDLEIIAYSLSMSELQEVDETGEVSVPLDALDRLVKEVKYLRARLDLAAELDADRSGGEQR